MLNSKQIKLVLPGVALIGALTAFAFFTGPLIPGLNAVIFGLVLGVLIGNLIKLPLQFAEGIKFSSGKILEFAIVMMAFEINLNELSKAGLPILSIVVFSIFLLLLFTIYFNKQMSCPGANGWLIGFGTAICGSAAISAIGPLITKDKSQIGISIAVINIIGGLGIFLVPMLIPVLNLNSTESGLIVGGSLHSMGHVAGSSALLNEEIRNVAISVKLVRIALLTPALILFSNVINRKIETNTKFKVKLPTYLIAFILISLTVTFFSIPKEFLVLPKYLSNIGLIMSMVAIGMGISFKTMIQSGGRAFLFGIIVFIVFLLIIGGLIQLIF
jgi:uncharacterized integral membrane protein (TIGR00698 family)